MVQCFAEYNKNYHKFIEVSELFACLFFFSFYYTRLLLHFLIRMCVEKTAVVTILLCLNTYILSIVCMYIFTYISLHQRMHTTFLWWHSLIVV